MLFYWPKLLYRYYSLLLFFTSSSVYRLAFRVWGLRTDRVYMYHSLLALHCRPFLIIISAIKILHQSRRADWYTEKNVAVLVEENIGES